MHGRVDKKVSKSIMDTRDFREYRDHGVVVGCHAMVVPSSSSSAPSLAHSSERPQTTKTNTKALLKHSTHHLINHPINHLLLLLLLLQSQDSLRHSRYMSLFGAPSPRPPKMCSVSGYHGSLDPLPFQCNGAIQEACSLCVR